MDGLRDRYTDYRIDRKIVHDSQTYSQVVRAVQIHHSLRPLSAVAKFLK